MPQNFRIPWEVGVVHRVTFRQDSRERVMTATYLGLDYANRRLFSLRPHAGTTALYEESLVWVEEMPKGTKHAVPVDAS
jgi:hypothetical protein